MKIKEKIEERLTEVFQGEPFHIIAIAITGSQAYGMNTKTSDTDVMGIFIPPPTYIVGVQQVEQVMLDKKLLGFEGTMFEFSKCFNLFVQQNPNVMELLWHVETQYIYRDTNYWPFLIASRNQLLSKKLKHSYAGYAWAQMQRLTKLNEKVNQNSARLDNFNNYGYDVKAASHVFRLLNTAFDALVDGEIQVMRPERQFLLAIREGKYTYEQLEKMANDKIALVEQAYITSTLPNKLNYEFANNLQFSILKHYLLSLWRGVEHM